MFANYQDYETAAVVVLALGFDIAERWTPARRLDRLAHFRVDLLALVVLLVGVNASRAGLGALFSASGLDRLAALEHVRALPGAARIAIAVVVVDFILYWVHRAMHRFDLLWRTHKFHHSIENLYWFSGFRTSLLHAFLYAIPQVFLAFTVLRLSALEAGIAFSLGVFAQLWQHANVDVNLGPLEVLIVTPQYHRVHHSRTRHQDLNLASMIALWDRLFGTYVDPKTVGRDYPMGLPQKTSVPRMVVGV